MSSILTNNSAMVALQTLRTVNSSLTEVQSQISTGKKVANAKDNAAIFAISAIMESDVAGFEAVSESLSLGSSTIAVARNGAESIQELLNEMKQRIVSANNENVDRQKIQDEIVSLRNQITNIVSTAQFNGLNLLDESVTAGSVNILSSLDRDSNGNVSGSNITVTTQNLSLAAGTDLVAGGAASVSTLGTSTVINGGVLNENGGTVDTLTINSFSFQGGAGALDPDDVAGGADPTDDSGLLAGDVIAVRLGSVKATYTVQIGDVAEDVAAGIRNALIVGGVDQADLDLDTSTTPGDLVVTNNTNEEIAAEATVTRGTGGLADLSTIDVTTAAGAQAALSDVEIMIQTAVDAAAAFGTSQSRVEIQSDFMANLIDNFKSGIGALVDADMEEASARLQALQVQQQLGIQSLSIANSAPQNLLALFR